MTANCLTPSCRNTPPQPDTHCEPCYRYEERAAILEFDGGMDRKRAEMAARYMLKGEAR